jgi:phosphopentomutase
MMDIKRIIVIVLDGVGIGEAPDAAQYGDVGSNSIRNTARAVGGLNVPNLGAVGLGCITDVQGVPCPAQTQGAYGKLTPVSAGKDSVTGHWEMMGIRLPKPFPTYPNGFPPEVIEEFTRRIGKGVLGNKAASGTEIIKELGVEHVRTGKPIVYTSADSVFQIAAHEEIIPLPELYRMCEIARAMLQGEHGVGRVIARPFIGNEQTGFRRTEHRHDYPLHPPEATMMDKLVEAGKAVCSVGKIYDLFGGRGITRSKHAANNEESAQGLLEALHEEFEGLLFANFIEFDMIFGHRNDPRGYANALERFDGHMPEIRASMKAGDLAIITGDHGVDPTTPSTDHSREYVPLLVFGQQVRGNVNLGTRGTFSDIGATIAECFKVEYPRYGRSFLAEVLKES